MNAMTIYDAFAPTFRGSYRANPFALLDQLFEGDFLATGSAPRSPAVDVVEEKERYLIMAELPGLSEKELKLELKDGLLSLSASAGEEAPAAAEGSAWLRRERRRPSFARSFELPEDADSERIEARFKDGLLTVELPKRPETAPRLVPVKAA